MKQQRLSFLTACDKQHAPTFTGKYIEAVSITLVVAGMIATVKLTYNTTAYQTTVFNNELQRPQGTLVGTTTHTTQLEISSKLKNNVTLATYAYLYACKSSTNNKNSQRCVEYNLGHLARTETFVIIIFLFLEDKTLMSLGVLE